MSDSNTEFLTKNTYPDMAQAQQYLDYMYEEVSVSLYGTNSSSDSEFIEKQMNHYENITIQCHSILHTLDYVTTHRNIFETLNIAMI